MIHTTLRVNATSCPHCGHTEAWMGVPPICKSPTYRKVWLLVWPPTEFSPLPEAVAEPISEGELTPPVKQLHRYEPEPPPRVEETRADPDEPIRTYVHFEAASDVAEFGRRIGITLRSSVKALKYRRDTEPIPSIESDGLAERVRDQTMRDVQIGLFGNEEWWEHLWKGMPAYVQRDLAPVYSMEVLFDTWDDLEHFEGRIGQQMPRGAKRTPSIWFPEAEIGRIAGKAWRTPTPVLPRHPVYVISKGRADTRLTQRHLLSNGIPYKIVVEPQELESYAAVIPREHILVLPFSNLGQGSIPARNWVWEHAKASGATRSWILDDNLDGFYRLHNNLKLKVETGATFRAIEDWSDSYDNVGMSGMNYFMFASRKTALAPLTLNTRIYSCILINHEMDRDLQERWRGRYNEDTDLSIRALKAGWCTGLFSAFLCMKSTTMTMKGGNTEALYKIKEGEKDGRLLMAESLRDQHPEIVQVTRKWDRWQHHVDYSGFRYNKLKPAERSDRGGEYGMELIDQQKRPAEAGQEVAVKGEATPGESPASQYTEQEYYSPVPTIQCAT